ncbi:hypothetical protein [Arthrobacter crystallopoietes]|uniref:Uncharacterized protein n=1 Tax=Crystallibacter crystallopoietes TaxID=37928 RepID=A0A1H0ZGY6_9MICC|nr:hypothetical protein [Arthrobacter crystallopoietes]AUI51984.1 hypothetical protein AC20117_15520 [Arthrobacter crystallopoietes]SDQ26690.1 hypothetical protein SAMN04489742_0352 [Arthrobacter crystallopoietes]
MQSGQLPLEVIIGSPATFHDQLEAAVAIAQVDAARKRQGILVTRHSYTHFTVDTSEEVPFRTTIERWTTAR